MTKFMRANLFDANLSFHSDTFFDSAYFPWLCGLAIFLVALLADRIILARLKIWAEKTEWKFDDVLVASIKGIVPFWGLCWGSHLAIRMSGINEKSLPLVVNVTIVLLILSITAALARFAIGVLHLYTENLSKGSSSIIPLIVRIGTWTLGILVALQSVGIQIAPVLTALGVGGLAVALAFSSPASRSSSPNRSALATTCDSKAVRKALSSISPGATPHCASRATTSSSSPIPSSVTRW
jgi:small-conductance mechanosensitive channel